MILWRPKNQTVARQNNSPRLSESDGRFKGGRIVQMVVCFGWPFSVSKLDLADG